MSEFVDLSIKHVHVIADGEYVGESAAVGMTAGTNVTLTATQNNDVIEIEESASGGGGSGLTQMQVEGLI